jgi:anti-anti-sigma factor
MGDIAIEDVFPVEWTGSQAVVVLPEHIDVSNSGQLREELLSVVNRGAKVLIADMTATQSCDHAGTDAVARAYQRGALTGTQVRLVVTAPVVRRALSLSGLDRLISIYPSLEAAAAAGTPRTAGPPGAALPLAGRLLAQADAGPARFESGADPEAGRAALAPTVLLQLLDALNDGVALTDDAGTIALANRRMEDMFGYDRDELAGRPIESLVPADLRAAHVRDRLAYERAPVARPMGARERLVGLRKDGATVPVQITLSPVPTSTGHFTLAVVRDAAETGQRPDLVSLARSAAGAEQESRTEKLLESVLGGLYRVGLSLHAAIEQPHAVARTRITDALQRLDEAIQEIRAQALAARDRESPGGG